MAGAQASYAEGFGKIVRARSAAERETVYGGGDFQLASGGTTVLDAWYVLMPSDDKIVVVRNCGPMGALIPLFETAVDSKYSYLNDNNYVSSNPGGGVGSVSITFFERK